MNNSIMTPQQNAYARTMSLINTEMTGIFGSSLLRDMASILKLYDVYNRGAQFTADASASASAANLNYRYAKTLIDREARFLFSNVPDITLKPRGGAALAENKKASFSAAQAYLKDVLQDNLFGSKLVKGARDCFIAKRVALAVNVNEDSGITVNFIPPLEFVFETDPDNVDLLIKFVQFYSITASNEQEQQRIYKKKYWMENGVCWVSEEVYNGMGSAIEELTPPTKTLFPYIPVVVIANDGLSGDPFGVSDIEELSDYESWYSKLSNKDMDSIRKGADQIVYSIDMSPESTKDLPRTAGSFWDMTTDPQRGADGGSGSIGVVDNNMAYSAALDSTLGRIKTTMYAQLEIPDTSSEALQGIISSGKTLKAIYWGLIVRCNEKMLVWEPALIRMATAIMDAASYYPEIAKRYSKEKLSIMADEFIISVENNYPLPEDETEEKTNDIMEVNAKILSRKSYMTKWRGLTDEEVTAELAQLKLEMQMLEQDNFGADFGKGGDL